MRTSAQEVAAYNDLTVPEVAKLLRCSGEHVRSLIRGRHLRAINIAPGSLRPNWRVPEAEVERFRTANTNAA